MRVGEISVRKPHTSQQRADVDVETAGDAQQGDQPDAAFAAFELTDERPVQASGLGELFLGEAEFGAAGADAGAELGGHSNIGWVTVLIGSGHDLGTIGETSATVQRGTI